MKRLVWCWWMLLIAHEVEATEEDRSHQRQRSLKKNRIHGDYYLGSQPDPIILRVDEGPGVFASTEKTGEKTGLSSDDDDDHVNATLVMKKLKGGTPPGGYQTDKRGEKDKDPAKPQKEERPPATSSSAKSKGSTKITGTGPTKKRQKKNEEHEESTKDSSSSKKTSKLKVDSKSMSKGKSKGEKGHKNTEKGNEDEDDDDNDDSDNGGSGSSGKCISNAASAIADALPQITTLNPESCCEQTAGIAAYLTHATLDSSTESGLSRFWQEAYDNISKVSAVDDICFVFVAASTADATELEQTMYDMTVAVSTMPDVVAMMVTDPTSTGTLMELVRSISNDATLPAIAVFNVGYSNVIVDSIVTGERRLPYIGSIDEADYGTSAATMTKELLNGATPVPMCFQANEDPQRCYAYYVDLAVPSSPPFPCNSTSASIQYDIPSSVNAIFAPAACCAAVIAAARDDIIIGCQDHDVVGGLAFVTQQPVALQAATAATWSNFVVQFGMAGAQSFPGLQTLVATDVYSILAS